MQVKILYKAGYKYQLQKTYVHRLHFGLTKNVLSPYVDISSDGAMVVREGYAWDGPSGPTFDTKSFMRGSLIHDALYQVMREGLLNNAYRKNADEELYIICREDNMIAIRAWWVYLAVRLCAKPYCDPRYDRPIMEAP